MPNNYTHHSNNQVASFIIAISGFAAVQAGSVVVLLSWVVGILFLTGISKLAFFGLVRYSNNAQFVACDLLVLVFLTGSLTVGAYEPELFALVKWIAAFFTGLGFALYHVNIGAVRWYGPEIVNNKWVKWLPSWRRNPYVGATMLKRLGFLLFAVYYADDPIIFLATGLSFLVSFERILNLLHDDVKHAFREYLKSTSNLVQLWYALIFVAAFCTSGIWNAIGAYASALIPVYFLILKLRAADIYDFRYWFPFLVSGAGLVAFALAMGTYPIAAYEVVAALFFIPAAIVALHGDRRWAQRREAERQRKQREHEHRERMKNLDKRREFLLKLRLREIRSRANRPLKRLKQTSLRSIKGRVNSKKRKTVKRGRHKRKRRPRLPTGFPVGFIFPTTFTKPQLLFDHSPNLFQRNH